MILADLYLATLHDILACVNRSKLLYIRMNYLIITFDGFGDGVIYYPFFKDIGEKIPKSLFFYSSNKFFSDNAMSKNLQVPLNFKVIDEKIRRFPESYWGEISMFIKQNNIKSIINLRTIGRKFEKNYYNFKDWFATVDDKINFYDNEVLKSDKEVDKNIRDIILNILQKGVNRKIVYDTHHLETLFPKNNNANSILVNMHSGDIFKLWEYSKWVKLIFLIASLNKPIKIYGGYYENEKRYTKKVILKLPKPIRNKIEIIKPISIYELGKSLQDIYLLISVDSGLIHLCDSINNKKSLGIYITTSPKMWGGVSKQFCYIKSKHMLNCKNYYKLFGMCINNKKKCKAIVGEKDDIRVEVIFKKIKQIYYEKN